MKNYALELMPDPESLSPEARAIATALLALQAELKLMRLVYSEATVITTKLNEFNLSQIEIIKRQQSGITPGMILPGGGGNRH